MWCFRHKEKREQYHSCRRLPLQGIERYFVFVILTSVIFLALSSDRLSAQENYVDLSKHRTLGDVPGGVKDVARQYGVDSQIWTTQIYQGIISGDDGGISRYGGKVDSFFKITHFRLIIF